jgi:hypothetical protein
LHSAAEAIAAQDRPAYVYHLGDFDPSGVDAVRKIEQTLRELASDAAIHFQRLAVLPEQIEEWRLPSRPTKKSDSRAKRFGEVSVELDAIDPNRLRELVESTINRHLPQEQLAVLKVARPAHQARARPACARWVGPSNVLTHSTHVPTAAFEKCSISNRIGGGGINNPTWRRPASLEPRR